MSEEFTKDDLKKTLTSDADNSDVHLYQTLQDVLEDAYEQAARGKGKERHGRGATFESQPMQVISGLLETDLGMAFQAIKKLQEGVRMEDAAARERELLGAIVYIAGIIVYWRTES